ncbi:PilZ domain-containing protein [uncultured Desulfosarcina sp.]|uniref:PilZ domain-containing protein n=1 Tax=uncultured Desulfosarcina sp. TaxID=218289 RepID=UPI0029C811ED|nr:PilZ domain-containing protein [uncultured Desulfosarcina sp.]
MKSTLITMLVSTAVFLATLWARLYWPATLSAYGRYYVSSILTISAIIGLIAAVRLVRGTRQGRIASKKTDHDQSSQRRQFYRLQYDDSPRPRFIQKSSDLPDVAAFTCPVRDVSETGLGLVCTGVYTEGQTVLGEIQFSSGRTAPINGVVLRDDGQHTSLQLHCGIEPALLMEEQRENIVREKAQGPRPVVSEALLDTKPRSLPSQKTRGLCRLKDIK